MESEIEKQLDDWDLLEEKLGQADEEIKKLVSEAQKMDALKTKVADYDELKSELEESKAELESTKKDLASVISEKDVEIAMLKKELDMLKSGSEDAASDPKSTDFASLNESLKRFSTEISTAKEELEAAKKSMSQS